MLVLEIGHAIFVMADLLLNLRDLRVGAQGEARHQQLGLVEDVEDVMEPGNGGQKLSIGEKVLA